MRTPFCTYINVVYSLLWNTYIFTLVHLVYYAQLPADIKDQHILCHLAVSFFISTCPACVSFTLSGPLYVLLNHQIDITTLHNLGAYSIYYTPRSHNAQFVVSISITSTSHALVHKHKQSISTGAQPERERESESGERPANSKMARLHNAWGVAPYKKRCCRIVCANMCREFVARLSVFELCGLRCDHIHREPHGHHPIRSPHTSCGWIYTIAIVCKFVRCVSARAFYYMLHKKCEYFARHVVLTLHAHNLRKYVCECVCVLHKWALWWFSQHRTNANTHKITQLYYRLVCEITCSGVAVVCWTNPPASHYRICTHAKRTEPLPPHGKIDLALYCNVHMHNIVHNEPSYFCSWIALKRKTKTQQRATHKAQCIEI